MQPIIFEKKTKWKTKNIDDSANMLHDLFKDI